MNWLFWRRTKKQGTEIVPHEPSWDEGMYARGFRHWMCDPPQSGTYVETARQSWVMSELGSVDAIGPETNICGLWWREVKVPTEPGGILELTRVKVGGVESWQLAQPVG